MEYKDFAFEMEVKDEDQGIIEGYASTFGNVDSYNDTVAKGAFKKTLIERMPKGIPMLWQHEMHNPIGRTLEASEDRKGLRVVGQLTRGVKQAEEAFLHLKAGSLNSFSIGYSTVKHSTDEDSGIRTLKEIKLYEWSPVTFPADEHARIVGVKGDEIDIDEIIRAIERRTTLTPEQLKDAAARILALIEREPDDSTHDDEPHDKSGEPPDGYSLLDVMQVLKTEGVLKHE